jgi:molybdopterin/thiamine biosynthesis adenylyltransferase
MTLIKSTKQIIVVGCGGTGSFLIPPLCRYLSSLDYLEDIILIDGDQYSSSNIDRQIFDTNQTGINKAECQAAYILATMPKLKPNLQYIDVYVGLEELDEVLGENFIIFNCGDNNALRHNVEQICLKRQNAIHICCGNEMFHGQVQISMRQNNKQIFPPIWDRFPQFKTLEADRSKMSCEELSKLPSGGQVISANMMAASLALNTLVGLFSPNKWLEHGTSVQKDLVQFNCLLNQAASPV